MVGDLKIPLVDYNFTEAQTMEMCKTFIDLNKTCTKCGTSSKYILILRCYCMLCKNCIKPELLRTHDSLFYNTFEAARHKEAICVCPTHGWLIKPKLLSGIFGAPKIEEYSILAVKRQLEESRKNRIRLPNLCVGCKGIISDAFREYTQVCYRHKLCKTCVEYFCIVT